MRRGGVAFLALTLIGLGVTGCGLFRYEQREPWRAQAEEACLSQGLVQPTAYMSRSSAIDGPGACGISYPFKVMALAGGSVGLTSRATLACPIIPSIDTWLSEVVQPAAALYFGSSVTDVKTGSYSCRPRNSRSGAKLSEHAFGNAVDIMGFRLADGREITVAEGWRGAPAEQDFLREVFVGACSYFTTVLGPGADMFHYDHFHLDLARHDTRGERRICKPALNFTPRLDGDPAQAGRSPVSEEWRSPHQQPEIDIEEDADPFAVSAAGTGRATTASPRRPPQQVASFSSSRARLQAEAGPGAVLPRPTMAPLHGMSSAPLPRPRPPGGWARQAPPRPPVSASRSWPAPMPPARAQRGYEPIPPYEPPPAPRSGSTVLQPQRWTSQSIF